MPKLIPVGKNFAIVDDGDYKSLSKFKWNPLSSGKYAGIQIGGRPVSMHRFLMGDKDGVHYDHVNGFGLDNRRCNLRPATQSENMRNTHKRRFHGRPDRITSSKYKGVYFRKDRNRWSAYIGGPTKNKTNPRVWLGCFSTEGEAAAAYNRAAMEKYGEFAKLNEIDPDDFNH